MGHGHEHYPKYVGLKPETMEELHPRVCAKEVQQYEDCMAELKTQYKCLKYVKQMNYCFLKSEPYWRR